MATCNAKIIWTRFLLCELGCPFSSTKLVFCDNLSIKQLVTNLVFHAYVKHIEIDYHFARDQVANDDLCIAYISTEN